MKSYESSLGVKLNYGRNHLEDACDKMYAEARNFFSTPNGSIAFEILKGPPRKNPRYFFIGCQPGRDKKDPGDAVRRSQGYENSWPKDKCEYATETWALAKKLRIVFEGRIELLEQSVGTNAIFVKSKNMAAYDEHMNKARQQEIKDFCQLRVEKLIQLMEPQKIILIGMAALNILPCTNVIPVPPPENDSKRKRSAIKHCEVFGKPAMAILHLSGAWPSKVEIEQIRDTIFR